VVFSISVLKNQVSEALWALCFNLERKCSKKSTLLFKFLNKISLTGRREAWIGHKQPAGRMSCRLVVDHLFHITHMCATCVAHLSILNVTILIVFEDAPPYKSQSSPNCCIFSLRCARSKPLCTTRNAGGIVTQSEKCAASSVICLLHSSAHYRH
jgi:hypothetical protein